MKKLLLIFVILFTAGNAILAQSPNDSVYVRKLVVGDSLGWFHQHLGELFSRQSVLLNSTIEMLHNGDNAIGRDIDFVKLRNGNLPNVNDEYGYINWRTKSTNQLANPAIQLIGVVGDTVTPDWTSGTLMLRIRRGLNDNPLTMRITQHQEFFLNGKVRIDGEGLSLPGLNGSKFGVNGSQWLWANSGTGGASLDLVRSHLGASVIPDDELGSINFWGRNTSNTYSQAAYIAGRVGNSVSNSVVAGGLEFGVRLSDGGLLKAMSVLPDGSVVIHQRPFYTGSKIDAVGAVTGSQVRSYAPNNGSASDAPVVWDNIDKEFKILSGVPKGLLNGVFTTKDATPVIVNVPITPGEISLYDISVSVQGGVDSAVKIWNIIVAVKNTLGKTTIIGKPTIIHAGDDGIDDINASVIAPSTVPGNLHLSFTGPSNLEANWSYRIAKKL